MIDYYQNAAAGAAQTAWGGKDKSVGVADHITRGVSRGVEGGLLSSKNSLAGITGVISPSATPADTGVGGLTNTGVARFVRSAQTPQEPEIRGVTTLNMENFEARKSRSNESRVV